MALDQQLLRKSIVLIDDDSDDCEILDSALKTIDPSIKLTYLQTGKQALELFNEQRLAPPDLIFLDLNMPGMNGQECLTALRKISLLNPVPIIVYSTTPVPEKLSTLGASGFLTKQCRFNDLVDLVRSLFAKYFHQASQH